MPKAAPKVCSKAGCGAVVHDGGTRCAAHPKQHNWEPDSVRGNRHERGYGKEWEEIRAIVLSRDNYLCVPCRTKHIISKAVQVDHKIPKDQGGTDSVNNLQSICDRCHKIKTARERHNKSL